jgi:hypothetical protein
MEQYIGLGISFVFALILSIFWVKGIDHMKEKYPNYKGEDFLDWGNETAPWETDENEDKKNLNTEDNK